jgi:hypothetical protein
MLFLFHRLLVIAHTQNDRENEARA